MPNPVNKLMQNLGVMAQLACVWEATARKPGNVHRFADFENLHYIDLLASAASIGGVLDKAWFRPVGEIVLEAVKATRQVTSTNTNLGIILLFAPIASVMPGRDVRTELPRILNGLTVADAVLVYEAIRAAEPGGMGEVDDQDIATVPTVTLREAMSLAEGRDRIAWQYTNDFADIFDIGLPALSESLNAGSGLETAIVETHLAFMAAFRDSLIERKHGRDVAEEVRATAEICRGNKLFSLADNEGHHGHLVPTLDTLLRSRRLNPGTSADLTAASLFVALREGIIPLPFPGPWSRPHPGFSLDRERASERR